MDKVVPAILTDDTEDLRRKLELLRGDTEWVQIDVTDGRFVPGTTVSVGDIGSFPGFLSIHLMVKNPAEYLEDCEAIGARRVVVHAEAGNIPGILKAMARFSFERGVALNPSTPVELAEPWAKDLDCLVLLSVVPGAQGHAFIPEALERSLKARKLFPELLLGMDGGIKKGNISDVFASGVDYAVVGSGIWKTKDPLRSLKELREMVQ